MPDLLVYPSLSKSQGLYTCDGNLADQNNGKIEWPDNPMSSCPKPSCLDAEPIYGQSWYLIAASIENTARWTQREGGCHSASIRVPIRRIMSSAEYQVYRWTIDYSEPVFRLSRLPKSSQPAVLSFCFRSRGPVFMSDCVYLCDCIYLYHEWLHLIISYQLSRNRTFWTIEQNRISPWWSQPRPVRTRFSELGVLFECLEGWLHVTLWM